MDDPASMEGSYRSDFKVPAAIRPDIAAINRAADDAGMPVPYCPKCGLPLNADSTHRTYEERDACAKSLPEPVSAEGAVEAFRAPLEPGWIATTLRRVRLETPMRDFVSRATDEQLERGNQFIAELVAPPSGQGEKR